MLSSVVDVILTKYDAMLFWYVFYQVNSVVSPHEKRILTSSITPLIIILSHSGFVLKALTSQPRGHCARAHATS